MNTLVHSSTAAPEPEPLRGEALVNTIDFFRLDAARRLDPKRQVDMGQFMTPAAVARLMASMFEAPGDAVRVLDAGAGVGSLSAALVAEMCARSRKPHEIALSAYEVDAALADTLRATAEACRIHCEGTGIRFSSQIHQEDFIEAGYAILRGTLFSPAPDLFDLVILNPPYRKINSDSRTRKLLEGLGLETTNLYTAFIAIAVQLLKPGGELVAITPRSFCNGPYFRPFRVQFLNSMALQRIHCFETRDQAFSDDEVLQENVIFHATKSRHQARVIISSSLDAEDECPTWREVDVDQIVAPADPDRFIHIPTDALSEAVTQRMEQFSSTLHDLGLEVSTGRVVDFRSEEHLRPDPEDGAVPLIYPGHIADGYVEWPKNGGKKPNALALTPATRELTNPQGFYVLVKRFSSKEERRRIVAAVYDPARVPTAEVAFENHLNYFHAHGQPLDRNIAVGLAAFLNSTLVDSHFRDWSGHTQVNASDLRRLSYPSRTQLEGLGSSISESFPEQDELDRRLEEDLLGMPKRSADPIRTKRRIQDATSILKHLGLPRQQQNERSALTLLALLDLKPTTPWSKAQKPLCGITQMMGFFAQHYGKTYAPNTRETVRRQTIHQFVEAGVALLNPDKPTRPTNSPQAVYQIEPRTLRLLRTFGTKQWERALRIYLTSAETLAHRYAQERQVERIPLSLARGTKITLSPGGQNVLVKQVIDEFCSRFTPGAKPVYVGDTAEKWAYFDETTLNALGVKIDAHGKMPDVVVYHETKGWLVLIEAVTSHGPVNPKRRQELKALFKRSTAGLVFVTAFLTKRDLTKYLSQIAWETEVWVAETPSHLIHFNGERFLGPFES